MSETYLTLAQVMERLQLAKSSVYRRIQDGTLPRPIKVGSLQRFKESEIEAAMDALAAKRKPQPQNGGAE